MNILFDADVTDWLSILSCLLVQNKTYIQGFPGGNFNILGGHCVGHSKKKVCMNMCLIPNGFRYLAHNILIWRAIFSFPPTVMRHCLKHVNRCEASVDCCDCC
jgi:hypothetical protein